MAATKKRAPPKPKATADNPFGLKRRSGLLRHTDTETFGANATVEIAQDVLNPGFGRGGAHTGIEIKRIMMIPAVASQNFASHSADGFYICQIHIGQKAATPVVLDPDDEKLFAHRHHVAQLNTSGGSQGPSFPMMIPIINVVPIIVEQYYSIHHQGANTAPYNSLEIFTIVDYYLVEVPDNVFTSIVLSRRDQT